MLGLRKKTHSLCTVTAGEVIDITKVNDAAFSQKILGEGFGVIPIDGNISSPADGTVTDVAETLHAYCIKSTDGLEILVHIGIDTVSLKGEGFTPFVKTGDTVKKGSPIAFADLSAIKNKGLETVTVVAVTNSDILKSFEIHKGTADDASYPAMTYKI